jgi:uncharacterized protein YcfJ
MNTARLLLPLALAGALPAVHAADFDDYARVTSVTPQLERYNRPQRECRTEYVQQVYNQPAPRNGGGAILGAIAGGIIGNQVGGGTGRAVATAAGTIAGAVAGDRLSNDRPGQTVVAEQPVQQCRMIDNWETRPNGYAVTYEYHGRSYTSVLPYDPGQRLHVAVQVTPIVQR